MNSKVIKFDKAPEICNSNHQTVPINMIWLSNKKTPICVQETKFLGLKLSYWLVQNLLEKLPKDRYVFRTQSNIYDAGFQRK